MMEIINKFVVLLLSCCFGSHSMTQKSRRRRIYAHWQYIWSQIIVYSRLSLWSAAVLLIYWTAALAAIFVLRILFSGRKT